LSVDRSWAVGSVTNIATSAPLTGGVITSTGTIGITQAGVSSNGYLSSTDWNTFNNKQNALTNPVTGTGTLYYIPMWNGVSSLTDSILSYSSNTVAFNYNSVVGATVNYVNNGGTPYAYTIQMNNFGSPRQTYHSYTDGNILQQINNNVVSKNLQSGQLVLPYYTATSSFTGTAAGYLGFDNLGNILSLAIPSLAGYVPYTGATQDVNLGEFGLTAGQLTLDTSPTGTAVVGTTRWNNTIGSSETTLKGGSVILKNGVDLVARVVNKATPNQTLTKAQYQAVRVSGAQGQRLAVALAQADGDPNSADTIGLVTETIPTNQEGFIITVGQLEGINTTGSLQGESWSDGDVLYLSPTTPGAVTNIKPNASTGHIVVMGYVEYAHINNGKIYVKIMNGWELDELHNVYINTPLNNQGLFYTSSTQLWENKSIATALGYTPVNRGGDTMTGYLILNADPVAGLGAATKDYVDNLINGIDWKQAANAGTVASLPSYNVTGSGQVLTGAVNGAIPSVTTDGVTLVAGNRLLVKDETSTLTPNNGIYVVTQEGDALNPFILTRASDANTSSELSEATISIIGGNTLISTQWHCNPAAVPIIIGTTYITFNEIGSGVYLGTAPIVISGNNISITQATTSTDGYLSSTDWNTFNSKQSTLSLTTSGSSGSSTLVGSTLNVPTYTLNGLGGASATTTLTINGTTYDLSANRSWSVGTVTSIFTSGPITGGTITSSGTIGINQSNAGTDGYLSSTDWNTFNNKQNTITLTTTGSSGSSTFGANILNVPTYTLSGLGGVPTSRTLTINGTAYDLSLDRSWSVGTVTSVAALTIGTSGTDITSSVANSSTTPVITLNIPTASTTNRGALSSTDWNTFNGKQDTITLTTTGTSGAATFTSNTLNIPQYQSVLTNPVTGTGTTNEIAYWTSSSAIGSLTTATYPSLTELSYVKGVTSAIQTQLNGKQGTLTLTTTGTSGAATLVGNTLNIPQYSGGGSMAIGGTVTSGTTGSILFIDPTATLAQDNANLFWDNTNNRLGIGTATPFSRLEVNSGTSTAPTLKVYSTVSSFTANLTLGNLDFGSNSSGNDVPAFRISGVNQTNASSGDGYATFSTRLSATVAERMRITAEGYVGIGTTTFTYPASNRGYVALNGTTDSIFEFKNNNSVAGYVFVNPNYFEILSAGTRYMNFRTNSIERMRITAAGRLLLGTTTEGIYLLDVNGAGRYTDNLLISANRNTGTYIKISNTTSGTASQAYINFESDATSLQPQIGKYSSTTNAFKIFSAKDFYIYNGTGGDIAILNDVAAGSIKFAAGASSTAHVTIGTTGLTTFATGVDYKRLNPTTTSFSYATTFTPDISASDTFAITGQAVNLSVANPTGTPVNGQKMIIRIKDDGTARTITWSGTQYRASSDLALPTTTIVNKTMYLGFIYNSTDTKWDLLAYLNNF
jgi:predicted heme/steroid binding protein